MTKSDYVKQSAIAFSKIFKALGGKHIDYYDDFTIMSIIDAEKLAHLDNSPTIHEDIERFKGIVKNE